MTFFLTSRVNGTQRTVSPEDPLPVTAAGGSGTNPNANPATLYTAQQAVTASAVALVTQTLVNGFVLKAKSTNTGPVFVGFDATVTTADNGTGKGYKLLAGESVSIPASTTASTFIIGTAADVVYVLGN